MWGVEIPAETQLGNITIFAQSAVAVDSAGAVHVVFSNNFGAGVWYTSRDVSGVWSEPEQLASTSAIYRTVPVALAIDGSDKLHVLAVIPTALNSLTVKYITNAGGSWATTTVDTVTLAAGYNAWSGWLCAIAVTPDGTPGGAYAVNSYAAMIDDGPCSADVYYWDGSSSTSIYHDGYSAEDLPGSVSDSWLTAVVGGIALDASGNPHVCYSCNSGYHLYDPDGWYLRAATCALYPDATLESSHQSMPGGVAVDADGTVHALWLRAVDAGAETSNNNGTTTDFERHYYNGSDTTLETVSSTGYYLCAGDLTAYGTGIAGAYANFDGDTIVAGTRAEDSWEWQTVDTSAPNGPVRMAGSGDKLALTVPDSSQSAERMLVAFTIPAVFSFWGGF